MKAMILAAGKGERMRPLTDRLPKALLQVAGKSLIQYQVERLVRAGITDITVNHALHGDLIEQTLGSGGALGASLRYSREGTEALETGGGILRALPFLGRGPFIVVNADIWTDYPYETLAGQPQRLAHVVLVDNPPHHPAGDFALTGHGVALSGDRTLTFGGIGAYRPELFDDCLPGTFRLSAVLRIAVSRGLVTGERYEGAWLDVGTPERLLAAENLVQSRR
ncbi:MAG: N-acetylmuramate alpha-1-phosphate uridylyltransferase MurU [Gammaproteobacteria bacterium]